VVRRSWCRETNKQTKKTITAVWLQAQPPVLTQVVASARTNPRAPVAAQPTAQRQKDDAQLGPAGRFCQLAKSLHTAAVGSLVGTLSQQGCSRQGYSNLPVSMAMFRATAAPPRASGAQRSV
jgi:hypothetical protein